MPRERRKWTEAEDAILRDAVLKGGDGACDWHLIASCIPGRTNKDCRKRWHYKVAATVNKGPWEVAEDERLWAAVQEHGSRWALVAQVVKTRNGDQCSKRWYDALDPSIDHSPWAPEEDARLLEAIEKHGRNWKAIVKAYFPRRTSLSAKNRYYLRDHCLQSNQVKVHPGKMEPKKQSQSGTVKKSSSKLPPKPRPQQESLPANSSPQFHNQDLVKTEEDRQLHPNAFAQETVPCSLSELFEPGFQPYNGNKLNNEQHTDFGSPECPPLSPSDWAELRSTNTTISEASFPNTTPPGSNEDMPLFLDDLHLSSRPSQGDPTSSTNAKHTRQMIAHSLSLDQTNMSDSMEFDFRGGLAPRPSNRLAGFSPGIAPDTNSRIVTVLINSEVSETVNRIVNQIGREDGVSIAIHLG